MMTSLSVFVDTHLVKVTSHKFYFIKKDMICHAILPKNQTTKPLLTVYFDAIINFANTVTFDSARPYYA
ncbi:hypothetical protein GCM10008018_60220 [Paenibacillus marchantiophytorum]|uniref:Uncharacterized protein n=1 Tax=Paenibacillus marchantiophytorum TaxID=1619310 RepID=A0ABQ1FD07_9BACL|nr:hypothetical protein GCM10008018_60220 [Paenibacillus marchantiophytorum]